MKWIWEWFWSSLGKSWFLWILFFINLGGTIYGFIWYKAQLEATEPAIFRIFVPDSPTASGLFTLVIFTYIMGRHIPLLEGLAGITSFKYGIWAVGVIFAGWALGDEIQWQQVMLVCSHLGMAIESVLYTRFYRLSWIVVGLAALWTLNNDFVDYTMDLHPYLPEVLDPYSGIVGLCTVALSIISISVIWTMNAKYQQNEV